LSPSNPTKPVSALFSKSSLLTDASIGISDLPDGEWEMSQERIYTPNMPLSVLVEQGALSFICKRQNVRISFAHDDVLFYMMQSAWKTQDLPPQQLNEWILLTNEALSSDTIFNVMKGSLQNCENLTFIEEKFKVRHSFSRNMSIGLRQLARNFKEQPALDRVKSLYGRL
jgi:chaperone required for assembly of F1-ATPase